MIKYHHNRWLIESKTNGCRTSTAGPFLPPFSHAIIKTTNSKEDKIMSESLGKKISELRKEKSLTQEGLAEALGISPQAVSKWENDLSCPDIMLLPALASLFDVSIDELFGGKQKETVLLPPESRKNPDELLLRVCARVDDDVKIVLRLPMPLVKTMLSTGLTMPQISGNDILKELDLEKVLLLVDNGLYGKLLEIEADDVLIEVAVE